MLEKVKAALEQKKTAYQYTEEEGCGSLDFYFRGLSYHVWEFDEGPGGVRGATTNIFQTGRSVDVEGDYEEQIAAQILSWPDMLV